MNKMKPILIIIIFAFLIGLALYTANKDHEKQQVEKHTEEKNTTGLKIDSMAPDFTLNTLDGKKVSLQDYRGKKVLLNFWATWCPPCREEIPEIEKFYETNKNKNIEILAVNLKYAETKPEKIKKFVKDYGITFPVPLDEKNEIGKKFRAIAIPTSYFINEEGIIKSMHVGPMDYKFIEENFNNMK